MAEYRPYLDAIFHGAEAVMEELAEETGEFTNQQFIKKVIRHSPGAYIDFLMLVKETRGETWAFNIVHEHIGQRLSNRAYKAGYEKIVESGKTETDIFGQPTRRVIYRREQ